MKRKIAAVMAGTMVLAMSLTGCEGSKGLETDQIKITQYKAVEVAEVEKPAEVTDEEVESAISDALSAQTKVTPVTDRAVESGDTVNIDFVGKMNGKEFEGGSAEGYDLTIGSGVFIDGFEDSIIGHEIGDTFDWKGKFPEDYTEELSGKDVVFTITVNAISTQEVPELTDEFVQSVSEESKTVEEYKAENRTALEEENQLNYESTLSNAIWEKILENTEVKEYPEGEIEKLCDKVTQQYKDIAEQYYGVEYESFIEEQMGTSIEEFEAQVKEIATENVKKQMAIEAIADKERIKLDDATYEKELEDIAAANMYEDVETLKDSVDEEDLKNAALANIVNDWLIKHCIQVAK